MRRFGLVVTSFVILLLSSAPAPAQTAGADQYSVSSIQSLQDAIQDSTETAAEGTQAIDEALSGTATPEASASAVNSAGDSPDKVAGLTELPETGGAPLLLPGAGALLIASGLLVRRAFR